MSDADIAVAMPLSDLVIAQTTVVTVCVAIMIWLGLLGRPSRATLYWTYGFILALLGSYASFTSAAMGQDVLLHPVAIGITCGLPTLIWSGLRVLARKRAYVWTGIVQSAASVAILWTTTELDAGFVIFTWLVLASGIAAAFGAIEVLRGAFRGSRFGTPLVTASGILLLLGVAGVIGSGVGSDANSEIAFARGLVLATTCYLICATVSLLYLANRRAGARDVLDALDGYMPEPMMRGVVREKLVRAAKRGEQNWSFIDIRIDDAIDLREATGDATFGTIARRVEAVVADVFPAEADLARIVPGQITIFVAQTSAAVRELVRTVLNSVGAPQADAPTNLRITVSAGIVTVDLQSDTYETLAAIAGRAAEQSQLQGGDRWVRVGNRRSAV